MFSQTSSRAPLKMNSSWKTGFELFLIVLKKDDKTKNWNKSFLWNLLCLHLLVAPRGETDIHKGIWLPSKQVGFGKVLEKCDLIFINLSSTHPPLDDPEDQVLGLVVIVDPVLESRWSGHRSFLGLGILVRGTHSSFHGLPRLLWRRLRKRGSCLCCHWYESSLPCASPAEALSTPLLSYWSQPCSEEFAPGMNQFSCQVGMTPATSPMESFLENLSQSSTCKTIVRWVTSCNLN